MPKLTERSERLLLQALKESSIEEANETNQIPPLLGGSTVVYWRKTGNDDIEIVLYSFPWFTGSLKCSVTLSHLADNAIRYFPKDADAVSALIEVLAYLRGNLSLLLPETRQGIYLRSKNLNSRSGTKKELSEIQLELVESVIIPQMGEAIVRFTEMNKRLRAEPKRGGSKARLEYQQLESLHDDYDEIQRIAKLVKKSYVTTFKTFESTHSRNGYKWEEWQEFWIKYATDLLGHEAEFLLLFAEHDNPSASEIAYRWLVAQTGYTRSYVEALVIKSRKAAGKSKRRKTDSQ
jgi:hypothetical protein